MARPNLVNPVREKKSAFVAYVPVIHHGYIEWFAQYPGVREIFLLSPHAVRKFGPTHKHIHGLSVLTIQRFLETLNIFDNITVIDEQSDLGQLQQYEQLYIPDEIISRQFVQTHLAEKSVTVTSIFLRWDQDNSARKYQPHPARTVLSSRISNEFMQLAGEVGSRSSDWWRQVGAIAVRDGQVIAQAHNTHLPSEQTPYIEGDGRAEFKKGIGLEFTTAIHAEAKLIAAAARDGLKLAGADLYVTDFTCPPCAKLVAAAQFSRLFYRNGYAVFDGERILTNAGVEIIKIEDD